MKSSIFTIVSVFTLGILLPGSTPAASNDKKAIRDAGGIYKGKFINGRLTQTDTGSGSTEIFNVTEKGKLKIPKSDGKVRTVAKETVGERDRLPATGKSKIAVRRNGKKVVYDVKQVKFDGYKGVLKGRSIKRGNGFQAKGKLMNAKRTTATANEVLKGTVEGKD